MNLSIEEAKKIVKCQLRLMDGSEYSHFHLEKAYIFDKLTEVDDSSTRAFSLVEELKIIVRLYDLGVLVSDYHDAVEDLNNYDPSAKKTYRVGGNISNALENFGDLCDLNKVIAISRKDLEQFLFDFAEVVCKIRNLPCRTTNVRHFE